MHLSSLVAASEDTWAGTWLSAESGVLTRSHNRSEVWDSSEESSDYGGAGVAVKSICDELCFGVEPLKKISGYTAVSYASEIQQHALLAIVQCNVDDDDDDDCQFV